MFGLGAIPAALFLVLVLTVPESPRWLVGHGQDGAAESVLATYTDAAGTQLLLSDIRKSLAVTVERKWSALWSPAVRGALFIAVGFTVLQQVTGINTVFYYGPKIFALAGIASDKSAIFATFLVACCNVLATVIALVARRSPGPQATALLRRRRNDALALRALLCLSQPGRTRILVRLVTWHDRDGLPDGLHRLLRLQHGAHWLDSRRRGLSPALARPRRGGCNAWLRRLQLSRRV